MGIHYYGHDVSIPFHYNFLWEDFSKSCWFYLFIFSGGPGHKKVALQNAVGVIRLVPHTISLEITRFFQNEVA